MNLSEPNIPLMFRQTTTTDYESPANSPLRFHSLSPGPTRFSSL